MSQQPNLNFEDQSVITWDLVSDPGNSETEVNAFVAQNSLTDFHIGADAIGNSELGPLAVEAENLAQMGAASGEVLKWNGTAWAPATDVSSGGSANYQTFRDDGTGMTQQPNANFVSTGTVVATLTNDGANSETEIAMSIPSDGVTATEIAAGAVGTSEIATDGVGSDEIAANAVGASELAATAVTAGSYGSATQVGTFTVDADGRLTAAANVTITTGSNYQTFREDGTNETQRAATNFLDGSRVSFTLTDDAANGETEVTADIVANSIGTAQIGTDGVAADEIAANAVSASELASTTVTAAAYGSATQVPTFTVDADGRLTAAANVTITTGSNYQTFREDGTNETQRAATNFLDGSRINFTLTDDAANGETEVAADIVANSIGTTQIGTDGVAADEIAANAVSASELASTTVTAAAYGSATQVPTFTVDADGRLTAAANVAITYDGNGPYSGNGGNGGNGTIPSLTTSTVTNQWTISRATDDAGGLVPVRISVAAGNEPDFMSFVNGSDSLLVSKGDVEFEIVANKPLLVSSSDVLSLQGDSLQVSTVPNAVENERTLLMLTPAGTIGKSEGLDPDIINQNGAATNDVLKWNGTKWAPAADATGGGGGGGDVLNNGNSFAASFVVGSNDNNTVNLEQNGTTVLTIGTDKNITATNSVAATNTVTDQLKLNMNSTGTAANSFGTGILLSGESSTTNDQEMARLRTYWTNSSNAAREAAFSIMLGNNAGALEEVFKLDRVGDSEGILAIGSSTPVQIFNDGIAPNTTFTFGGNNQNITVGTLAGTIELERQTASTTAPLDFAVNAQSSGTPAAGFGVNLLFLGESNTTVDRTMGNVQTLWTTATDISRTSDMVFNTVNSATTNEAFRLYGNKRAMVGGGTNQASAALQVNSTTGGFLGPKGTDAEMLAIASPVEGLEFWNTTIQGKCVYDGTDWQRLSCRPAPTVTAGTGAGTGATVSVVGNDLAGVITVVAGTSPATNAVVVTLDFHTDFDVVPKSVSITGANLDGATIVAQAANARGWSTNESSITVDEFTVVSGASGNVAVSGTTYKLFYKVGQ